MLQPTTALRSTGFRFELASATARLCVLVCAFVVPLTMIAGCTSHKATVCDLNYCDDITGIRHYRDYETKVEYPCIDNRTAQAVAMSGEPHNILQRADDATREIRLAEVIQIALSHNDVIETSALGGVGAKTVLTNPNFVSSVYDPAIQRSGVLFGAGRGVEAALSDFDTTFSTSMLWGRADAASGVSLPSSAETGTFRSSLRKQFAYGASLQLNNNWNYLGAQGAPAGGFLSTYTGNVGAQYRQPLLAGAGTEYTRIAGPTNPAFGAITGVGQGVLIARISSDISIADFEISIRNALRDIENSYWDLYLTYRTYDTAVVAHQSAYQTWRESQDRLDVGILKPADELQTRDRLYETKASVENLLSDLFKAEAELRRLIGLPMNDGTVIRPVDEPVLAEFIPDWTVSVTDGLTHRVELRRQKWNVKSTQLQLTAARSLIRPQLDFVGSYDVNAYGDNLLSAANTRYSSAVGSLRRGNLDSWTAGFELSMPIGLRRARSQVRNIELQLTKSMAVLASQEKNIAHDIAISIQDVTSSYAAAQSNHKRLAAATRRVELLEAERDVGTLTLDLVLRAQASLAAAESAYYQQLVRYSKALTGFHLSTGKLLDHHGVHLAEGPWCADAGCDAVVRAHVRTHAKDAPRLTSEPCEFVSPGPAGSVDLHSPDWDGDATLIDPILPGTNDGLVPDAMDSEPQPLLESDEEKTPKTGDGKDLSIPSVSRFPRVLDKLVPERLHIYDRNPPRSASAKNDFPSLIIRN